MDYQVNFKPCLIFELRHPILIYYCHILALEITYSTPSDPVSPTIHSKTLIFHAQLKRFTKIRRKMTYYENNIT